MCTFFVVCISRYVSALSLSSPSGSLGMGRYTKNTKKACEQSSEKEMAKRVTAKRVERSLEPKPAFAWLNWLFRDKSLKSWVKLLKSMAAHAKLGIYFEYNSLQVVVIRLARREEVVL